MNAEIRQELERLKELIKKDLIAKIESIDDMVDLMQLYNSMSNIHAEDSISSTEDILSDKPEKYQAYNNPSSYRHKVVSVLKIENKFLNINEISNIIHKLEPDISFEQIKKGVSSAKSNLISSGAIVKYVVGSSNQNSFYGSSSWLDEDGNPKPEHMYNEESLVVKEEVKI
ncbi:hypothetical protein I2I11_00295 [Pontibacter sp. 172403-2]|uniref:hypothetical protein n=1 Tax=Pontibacter rufus TaxID=2791028 RepID=UPI0018B00988|nr:hypothetical protein [Pontibacter sp. 172403-2]MBF9251724.1 hypothetical protein [Pontibacter sp. 172403-2]